MKKIWISWERHRRTREIADIIKGLELFEICIDGKRITRYPYLLVHTAMVILREKPDIVFVQNPSIVLSMIMVLFGRLIASKVIVDAHNEGIRPYSRKLDWLLPIYRMVQRKSDLTIVTNDNLAQLVMKSGGTTFVLEDKIPKFEKIQKKDLLGRLNFVLICTFEKDEPFVEVIKAAKEIDHNIYIYVTGNTNKAPKELLYNSPKNVIFTGFLSESHYANLLYSSDCVIDLTFMDDCLVCGAYEAVALGKPMILSDTVALRNYFRKGAVYTENNCRAIIKAIISTIDRLPTLKEEVAILREELETEWHKKFERFCHFIN